MNELIELICRKGVCDHEVLEAISHVPREEFVPLNAKSLAYEDRPLPIGQGQTISQPSLVAFMTQQLSLNLRSRVLEVGTGCGYQTAILSELAREVFTVEVRADLLNEAQERLERLGFTNIHYKTGDGMLGWPENSPYDAILVTAAARNLPQILFEQLKEGGRLIVPVGGESYQHLLRVRKINGEPELTGLLPVRFVPIVGAELSAP